MASTEEILQLASKLGQLLATHPAAGKLEQAMRKIEADPQAQRAMADFNRLLQTLGDKEAAGQPIEPAEKQQLEKLQAGVIRNPALRDFQVAQMDYADLMRRVDEAMYGTAQGGGAGGSGGGSGGGGADAPASIITTAAPGSSAPILNPDVLRGARG